MQGKKSLEMEGYPFLKNFWKKNVNQEPTETSPLVPKDGNWHAATYGIAHKECPTVHCWETQQDSFTKDEGPRETSEKFSWNQIWLLQHRRNFNTEHLCLLPAKQWNQKPISVSSCCVKYILVISNLLLSLLGLLLLAIGVWGLADKGSFAQERIGHLGADPMLALLLLGLIIFSLTFAGCLGALRENEGLLRIFSWAVMVLIAIEVLAGIIAYFLHSQINGYLRSSLLSSVRLYQDDADLRFIMDEIQVALQCCGADTYRDWELNMYFNCTAPGILACGVPASCCINPLENGTVWNSQCGLSIQQLDEFTVQSIIYMGGCLGGLSRWLQGNAFNMAVAGVVLLAVQALGLILASYLLGDIKSIKAGWQQPYDNK
ncbi:tetraspanin-10 [Erpetoichthys calabaricus]|uniref:tetraspanin-10 n=1 Tax=Erpetoichthys calabaricus TaxID=27687 RepID=UPI0022346097|nr:tetraspanin-10 [Erpetoichthys calabaricus]XP_051774932.1 tetraspanin-10 [Erpetoichthys calabaricus]